MSKRLPIFYSALLLTGVNLLLRLVSTSFQVFISGRMGPAGVGLLQLVMSVGMMSMTAGMAGVRTATMYLTAEELGHQRPGNIRWVLSGCVGYSILCSGGVGILLSCFAAPIAQTWIGDLAATPALRLFAGFLPVSCLCGVMTGYFTAANRIGTLAVVEIAEQVASMTVTMTALTFWAGTDPGRACCSVVLGGGMGGCITLLLLTILRLCHRPPAAPRISVRSRLLRVSVPLGLADDLKTGINTLENLMVPKRLGLYEGVADPLAAFGTVSGMVFPVLMFPAAILFALAELLIPELARCAAAGSSQRIEYLVRRSLRLAMLYGCCFAGLMYLLARPLCQWLYQSSEAGTQLQTFALLIPMLYCDAITDAMTKGLGQQVACVRYNILTSAMDVVGLYLLLPILGMQGYFISFFLSHLVNFLLSLRRLIRITSVRLRLREILLCAACLLLGIWGAGTLPTSLLRGIAFVGVFFSTLCLSGVLGREDLHWVRGLLRR